jgi:hypothetical protein
VTVGGTAGVRVAAAGNHLGRLLAAQKQGRVRRSALLDGLDIIRAAVFVLEVSP